MLQALAIHFFSICIDFINTYMFKHMARTDITKTESNIPLVPAFIRGWILLNGNEFLSTSIPRGSILLINFQDTSIPDSPARNITQVQVSNLIAFPLKYEMIFEKRRFTQYQLE
ncbi:unnamed protein product [Rotaria magnacalcarata]|uniref:Uncharacterized protein n=1 Tax=Rotaria magnacalcarata TaxID=392030 RepID=A0A816SIR1_9BILA|nr:unnamed protein product [Rotaria magnacalcarata]